ncbi:putative exonuclease GOR [Cherax quadricarinatus]|uniref:putative exonuclease GOR n=1 Tax=Cherax quadricarinatus TaxID=27406 RepID=UPI00387E6ACB
MAVVDKDFYNKLQGMKMSEDDLRRFCFPRSHWQSGKAQLFNIEQSFNTTIHGPRSRTCKRCNTVYRVDNEGCAVNLETCVHHWAKVSRSVNPYYHCCKRPINSPPCATAPQHVTEEIDQFNLTGFINTSLNQSLTAKAIYAIDCEMLYTKTGMDVAAISIVDSECQLVYETLILPESPIVDYNTGHSGLTMQQFRHVSTRLADVHAKLLTLFGSRTILVGHGLDHDLLRLKVIHDHIIDTSVLFPHPKGFPIRNSLSYLVSKYGMQFTSFSGLKCQSDAKAAMYLVRHW